MLPIFPRWLLRPAKTSLAVIALLSPAGHALASTSPARPGAATGQKATADPTLVSAVFWSVLAEPIFPVKGTDGRIHLVYELNVSNASRYTVNLDGIEALDGRTGLPTGENRATSSDGQDITWKIRPFSVAGQTQTAADFTGHLDAGQGGMIYMDLAYPKMRDLPKHIKHRITIKVQLKADDIRSFTANDAGTVVKRVEAVEIRPPLTGDGWMNANGSGPIICAHRYAPQATNGRLRSPEHFAIDFIKLNPQGFAYADGSQNNASYFGYGQDVVSVAAGRVVEVSDGAPDQVPLHLVPPSEATQYTGNHVTVAIGDGKYALYAHLAPGSVAVKKGQKVVAGQLLGKLGSSGNSDAPHLHFQVMDSISPFNTHGLPFVFKKMNYQGHFQGTLDSVGGMFANGDRAQLDARGAGLRLREMPLTLDVMGFK